MLIKLTHLVFFLCSISATATANNGWGDASMTEMNFQKQNLIFLTLIIWPIRIIV